MAVSRRLILAICLLPPFVAGCGQKGPLYLEGHKPHGPKATLKAKPPNQPPAPVEQEPAEKDQP
ncbi:LPS translocon maturation chaperone LptM [Methylomagnum sp.]